MARCVCQALLLSSCCQALVVSGARARVPAPTMSIIERPDSALFCLNVCLRVKPERGAMSKAWPAWTASAARAADWPRLAEAPGSLEHTLALKEALGRQLAEV